MAKRSDFAQKLLDDLRLRKERMGVSNHQSSRGSKLVASDAYTYARQTNRISGEMRTQQTAGYRSGSGHNRHSSNHKSISMDDASRQVVPIRRGQQSHQQIGDLSMALTYAIENGAKLGRLDAPSSKSMLNFLHQISRRSADWGNIQKPSNINIHFSSSSHLPVLPHHHIQEISKGAQRLNQILRACSNGHNFDTYSVEIGKELLKGATELEESLRMLVNLQESSDYMVTQQSKSRIKLLDDNNEEEEEEDDDNDKVMKGAVQTKQIGLPMFSFDKSSRTSSYIKDVKRADLRQSILALPYPSELPENFSHVSSSSFVTHKRSPSHGSNKKNQPSPSKAKPEKKRISNVVAKLMGLEELPATEDVADVTVEEASSNKKISGYILNSLDKGNVNRRNTKDVENLVPPLGRKQKQVMHEKTYSLESGRNLPLHHDGRQIHRYVEGLYPMRGSNMANMKMDKQQSNNINIQEKEWKQKAPQIKRGHNVDDLAKISPLHDQHQRMILPQPMKTSEAGTSGSTLTEVKAEKRVTNKQISGNRVKGTNNRSLAQGKSPSSNEFQQQPILAQTFETEDMKQQKTQMRNEEPAQRSEAVPNSISPIETDGARNTKRVVHNPSSEELRPDRRPTNAIAHKQNSRSRNLNENPNSRDLKPDDITKKKKSIIFSGASQEEKPARPPTIEKVETKTIRAKKVETASRIDELAEKRRGTSPNLSKLKQQASSTLPQKKQRGVDKRVGETKETQREKSEKLKKTKVALVKSKKATGSIQQADISEEPETKPAEASQLRLHDHLSDDSESMQSPKVQVSVEKATVLETDDQEEHQVNSGGNDEHGSRAVISYPIRGTQERPDIHISHQQLEKEEQKVRQSMQIPEPLTEAEKHLKQLVVKNQRFLDTAEALFRLNIPIDILNVSNPPDSHEEEKKLMIDCSFEVMKRKGKRQEILRRTHHPYPKLTANSTKRESLDGLIQQLYRDLEKLRLYGRIGNAESEIEDYLPKMLEIDVHGSEPDVNSMWEIGWEKPDTAFPQKDEVIREVEKQVLNGLLDDLARDFLALF